MKHNKHLNEIVILYWLQLGFAIVLWVSVIALFIGAIIEKRSDLFGGGIALLVASLLPYFSYKVTKREYENGEYDHLNN